MTNKIPPENCMGCKLQVIGELGFLCEATLRYLQSADMNGRPSFCPYEIAEQASRNCANCHNLELIEGKTIYAWCPKNKWAFENFKADTRHSCCASWRDNNEFVHI